VEVNAIGKELGEYAFANLQFDCIVGLPNTGDPLADAFPKAKPPKGDRIAQLRLRKVERDGMRRICGPPTGNFQSSQLVLVIDDLITRAETKLEGIAALTAAGLQVTDLLVLVDREQGGADELAAKGYNLHSLFSMNDFLGYLVEKSRVTVELQDEIMAYIAS